MTFRLGRTDSVNSLNQRIAAKVNKIRRNRSGSDGINEEPRKRRRRKTVFQMENGGRVTTAERSESD